MTKKEQFVILVQTAAIVESMLILKPASQGPTASELAALTVHQAMKVRDELLPDDISEACLDLIAVRYHGAMKKPWMVRAQLA